MLERAVADGRAPTFAALLERGVFVPDCVSSFPSVTPVACAEMVTGVGGDRHWISGMNWYHRLERRYVEYGSSLEATRAFGIFRALYDLVYNMNLAHLSPEVETLFEALDDAGERTACTPFLIYRGRHRHQVSLEGLMKRAVDAGRLKFHHHTWGPAELFYGELYASREVPCKATSIPGQPRRLLGLLRGGAGARRRLRLPAPLPARQRQLLPPPRAGGERRVDRQGGPLLREAGRRGRRARRVPRLQRADPARRPCANACRAGAASGGDPRPGVGRSAALGRPAGRGAVGGQSQRPRGPRLPAAGGGRASGPVGRGGTAGRDRGRRADLLAGGR